MVITIGGNVGAGKTTLAKRLAEKLGWEEINVGGILRDMAAERGMTIEQFYQNLKREPELEKSVDERQAKIMQEKDNVIAQGHIAWFFAKKSPFKVLNIFLAVEERIGAQRTGERPENLGREMEELLRANAQRTATERERYRELYGIDDFLDPMHYDFVLETSNLSEDDVFKKVIEKI